MEPPQTNHTHHLQQQWKSLHSHQADDNASLTASKFRRLESPRDHEPGPSGMAASPVRLGLGLGLESGKCVFTFLQLQELEHQALIFKYMMAGIPVPLHLVLPIWKSVVSSPMGIIQPSTVGGLCFDFRNSMEPEPGRCRRTDGKKWRCSKEVVPDHKYCEKHMNRGRNRSRKPVKGTRYFVSRPSPRQPPLARIQALSSPFPSLTV